MIINASPMSIICAKQHDVIAVYKPRMLPTVPGLLSPSVTELLVQEFPEQSKIQGFHPNEGGLLYRLDNETSGLVLFATDQETFEQFHQDTAKKQVRKHYLAYVEGCPRKNSGIIQFPIGHHPRSKKKMVAQKELSQQKRSKWRPAETFYQTLSTDNQGNSWLHLIIYQGSRHQIRVHCAAIGHPLVGDKLYNPNQNSDQIMLLQCHSVEWIKKQQTFSLTDLALPTDEKGIFPELDSLTIG